MGEQLRRPVDRFSAGGATCTQTAAWLRPPLSISFSIMEPAGDNPTISVQDHNYTYMFNFEQDFEHLAVRGWMEDHWRPVCCWASGIYMLMVVGGQVIYINLLEPPNPVLLLLCHAQGTPSQKAHFDNISGTKRGTIDPLVSKRPEKNSE